jgi:hypothetical protein
MKDSISQIRNTGKHQQNTRSHKRNNIRDWGQGQRQSKKPIKKKKAYNNFQELLELMNGPNLKFHGV